MLHHFKKLNKEAIFEIALGMILAIMLLRMLSVLFGRQTLKGIFDAESAEDLENLHGRGRARRAAKRETRRSNKKQREEDNIRIGQEEGAAGKQGSVFDDDDDDEQEQLEMAEYFDSLSQDDIANMDSAEYSEYLDYLENQ